MKSHPIILLTGMLAVFTGIAFANKNKPLTKNNASPGFALVELYTSEGCSSCPPADRLVAKIRDAYQGKEVYILAYHVDYWNRLGWKDAFSSPQYSQRQNNYAGYLHLSEVYTPQVIVNGRTEFVGSDESKMQHSIQQSLATAPIVTLSLSGFKQENKKVTLQYHISGSFQNNSSLYLAVVQKHAQTVVKAGENGGHTLTHINIVNKLENISLKNAAGSAGINLPSNYNPRDWSIICFVQNNHNGEILAVQKATPENI